MIDVYGNDVAVTLYESYLSKAIVEATELYQDCFLKIALAISDIIKKNLNANGFERYLFSTFSIIHEEFPGYLSIDFFLNSEFNVFAATTLHKLLFEFLSSDRLTPVNEIPSSSLGSSLRTLISKTPDLLGQLRYSLDPNHLFDDNRSGRKEKKLETYNSTKKLGITSEKYATKTLREYFGKGYTPGQTKYRKDKKARAVAWLEKYSRPFISGMSGTVGTCYSGVIQLGILSTQEIRLYLMVLTATLVARGHHSFAEAHPVIKNIGFPIEEMNDHQKYYEQFLTADFIDSVHYQEFQLKMKNLFSDWQQESIFKIQ